MAAVGEEATIVQTIEPTSFQRMDFVFFSGDEDGTRKHWMQARRAAASIVDLTYALENEPGVLVRASLIPATLLGEQQGRPNLATPAIVAAHPAAVMLGLAGARLAAKLVVRTFAAIVYEPASEHGREAMDELHQQTVNLLSFKDLPREQYDAQAAFNLLPALGESAKVNLTATAERIRRHYGALGSALPELTLDLLQAPVFHGYVASVLLELDAEATVFEIERALEGESIDVVSEDSDPPSNLSAAGQEDVMVRVRTTGVEDKPSRRFWLWLAADNLKLHALNAIACANELKRLRPRATVQ
jgi:aspartate-semialdehyde dehydrogenase